MLQLATSIVMPALMLLASLPAIAASHALKLDNSDFPDLVIIQATPEDNTRYGPDCAHMKVRSVDELKRRWRSVIERIDFECKDINSEESGYSSATSETSITVFLKPNAVTFAGFPVIELRMKNSDLWGDAQFILDAPFTQTGPVLQRHLETTCGLSKQRLRESKKRTCVIEEGAFWHNGGLYIKTSELGGTWAHPEEEHPQLTVYAEAWSD
jgi:hypothetical protein